MNTKHLSLLAIAIAIGLAGCNTPAVDKTTSRAPTQVTTDVVKRQDLTGYSFFDGKLIIPDSAKATAYSPYDTPVLSVMTGDGKQVSRGQPIVKLTIPGADAAAEAAKTYASSAAAEHAANKGLNSPAVADARRLLDEARATERQARDLIANGGQADLEDATRMRMQAEETLKVVEAEYRQSVQPTKVAVDQAAAYLREAKADAARGIVRAPISGTVVSFDAQPGMMAKSKQPLATIINFSAVRVQGLVPPELKDLVVKHSRVIISLGGPSSDPLDGTVVDVSVVPPADGQTSPGYLAVIQLLKPQAIVQPTITVKRIGVKTGTVKDALVIPVGALNTIDGKSSVNVKSGDKWIATPVELGLSDGALVEIKSGLKEGDVVQVVTTPQAAA